MRAWLLDTGPVVAYLDRGDPHHALAADRLEWFTGSLLTSSAVITEAMHLVSSGDAGPRALADFVAASEVTVYDFSRPPEIAEAVARMEKYRDLPMDFADATLVLLAEVFDALDVLTLDRRGFRTYRTRDGRAFRLVLDEPLETGRK